MIAYLSGVVRATDDTAVVLEVSGVGYRVALVRRQLQGCLPGDALEVHTYLHVGDGILDLYGFSTLDEQRVFQLLITVSGVGPKLALAILDSLEITDLAAAVEEGRADLLSKTPGVGKKTADRMVVELKGKLAGYVSGDGSSRLEDASDILEILLSLGYRREDAVRVVRELDAELDGLEVRLKAALAALSKR